MNTMKYWLLAVEVFIGFMIGVRQKSFSDGLIAFLFCHFLWGISNNFLD